MSQNSKQAGGTILGVIVGLIVGLGIAVVVAVAITKTPVPFINKQVKAEKPVEPTSNRDPNKPLYGNKEPAKEAAKEFAKTEPVPEEEKAAEPPVEKPEKPEKPPVAKLPPKEETPPVVDKSIEKPKKPKEDTKLASIKKPDEAPVNLDNSEDKWTYYLQAGAFRAQGDAENTRAKLALAGVEARITELQTASGNLYRVRIGPFSQAETMNRMRTRLSDNGVDVAVVRTPR